MTKTPPNVILQWLLPVVVLSVTIGYGLFYYYPNSQERFSLSQQEREGMNAELMNDVVLTTLRSDQCRLLELNESLKSSANLQLSQRQVMKLPGQLHKMADRCGIRIAQLTPANSHALETYSQHRYSLKLSGSQSGLLDFLCQLETEFPSIRISQFNTSLSQASQVNTAQLTLEVFAGYSENSN